MQRNFSPEELRQAQRIHVMGVCGTGMGTFAGILKARGVDVRGSDAAAYPPMSDLLAEWNIEVMRGYRPENLEWNPDFVIVGNVIRRTNPEAVAMRERGIPHASFPEGFSALLLEGRHPIVISGTHGKTTTTSLTAWLLADAGLDPGLLVGGLPLNFGASFLLGQGPHFVVEGDEYDTAYFDKGPKFLHYQANTLVITNIEFDHADIFANVDAIETQFSRLAAQLPPTGRVIYWAGCQRAKRAANHAHCTIESYGLGDADWSCEHIEMLPDRSRFELVRKGESLGQFTTQLYGDHNLLNATAALAVAIGSDVDPITAAQGLSTFRGVKKRLEIKGICKGVTVIDDFAHHPTAVRATVRTVRNRFPAGRLICAFEVESNTSRRRIFQADYPPAFEGAHTVLFCKPLEKADNLSPEERLSLPEVVEELRRRGIEAHVIEEVNDMITWLIPRLRQDDVVLGMSGRHFHGLHRKLVDALEQLTALRSGE